MTDEKKYRTEIPNIIDDLGLSPYERTLYVHYKRVCGANGGQCTEGVRGTAERTKISQGKVSAVRSQLVKRGLIQVEPFGEVGGVSITIIDIWLLNSTYYATKDRPNVDGWTIEKLTEWVGGVHTVNTPSINEENRKAEEGNRSPGEQGCSYSEQGCSPGEHKKEPIKKEPKELPPNGGNSGKPLQPEISQPAFSGEFTLEPDTPETRLLFEKINSNRQVRGMNQAKKFKSLEQKQKCLEAATHLGYANFEASLTKGLETGLTDLTSLVNWIAKWGKGTKNGARYGQKPKTKNQTTEPGPIDPDTWNQMLKSVA